MLPDGAEAEMVVALCLASGLASMLGGVALFAYETGAWLIDGLWQPIALADLVTVPATRSLLGLNALLAATFHLPIGVDLVIAGALTLAVGRQMARWRSFKSAKSVAGSAA
ncbi:MAG TPA: hypothetical protein VMB81_31830 [Candidatus Sulfotelmatobacter sp.]|nr:hypothetical protein [Candidatus Sulfotelmatobacter sp.]